MKRDRLDGIATMAALFCCFSLIGLVVSVLVDDPTDSASKSYAIFVILCVVVVGIVRLFGGRIHW